MRKIIVYIFMVLMMCSTVFATDQVVTSDADDGGGELLTLREAIAAVGSGETITFSADYTITLASQLTIDKSLTITGTGEGQTIIQANASPNTANYRVFYITAGDVTLENMTIQHGQPNGVGGGGIWISTNGIVTINSCTVNSNSVTVGAGGGGVYIENTGTVNINNSSIINNTTPISPLNNRGGGIFVLGGATLNLTSSNISNNIAKYGAGICNYSGTLNINHSTVALNTGSVSGGGIYNGNSMNIVNSTITGNSANSGFGGGIYNGATTYILNSIVIDNSASDTDDIRNNGTCKVYYSWYAGYNALDVEVESTTDDYASGDFIGNDLSYTGGFTNTYAIAAQAVGTDDEKAASGIYAYFNSTDGYYFYNGSNYTKIADGTTFSPSSPSSDIIETDQRGYYRTSSAITRGAYQYNGIVAKIGTATSWTTGANYTTIDDAYNAASSGNIIELAGTAIFESGIVLDESKTITIKRDDALSATTYVQAAQTSGTATDRVFIITNGTVTLEDMTVRYGNVAGNGGGINIYRPNTTSELNINNVMISENIAEGGGGIYVESGASLISVNITNSTINENTATDNLGGGGIFSYDVAGGNLDLYIGNSTISGNIASHEWGKGGGIYHDYSTHILENSTISGNSAGLVGGGVYLVDDGVLNIKNSILANNTADSNPNDYYFSDGHITDNGYNIVEFSNVAANATGGFNSTTSILYNTEYEQSGTGHTSWTQGGSVFAKQTLYLSSTLALNNNPNGTYTLTYTDGSSLGIDDGTGSDLDQRGAAVYNGTKDIGAYEWEGSPGTLPVELSAFTAQFIENTPTIYWSTQSETDNMGWFVYRNEENDFTTSEKISEFIEGHGTTSQQQSYLYEDSIEDPEVGDIYYYWLESIDYSGIINHYDNEAILTIPDNHGSTNNLIPKPERFGLLQNEPNPVINSTRFAFNLHETAKVDLAIYNLKGQLVKKLYSGTSSKHTVMWNGKDEQGKELENGIYLYRLLLNGKTEETKKLILLR
jgi:hypothetical protein